jgi:hypothetical protein
MRIVVADIDDERADVLDYILCVNRIILQIKCSFKS